MILATKPVLVSLIVAATPMAAIAGISSVVSGGVPISITAGTLTLMAAGIAVGRGRAQRANTAPHRVLNRYFKSYQRNWREWAGEVHSPGEIESAICSFESYLKSEGLNRIADFITTQGQKEKRISVALLEQAAEIQPGAYRELNARGNVDYSTEVSRRFFLAVMDGAIQEVMRHQAVPGTKTTVKKSVPLSVS